MDIMARSPPPGSPAAATGAVAMARRSCRAPYSPGGGSPTNPLAFAACMLASFAGTRGSKPTNPERGVWNSLAGFGGSPAVAEGPGGARGAAEPAPEASIAATLAAKAS